MSDPGKEGAPCYRCAGSKLEWCTWCGRCKAAKKVGVGHMKKCTVCKGTGVNPPRLPIRLGVK